jgi:hypothetical protein
LARVDHGKLIVDELRREGFDTTLAVLLKRWPTWPRACSYKPASLTFIRLVRTGGCVDRAERFGEVADRVSGGGQHLPSSLDRDGAVSAGGAHEFLDAPTGLVLDLVRYGHCGERGRQAASIEFRVRS